MARSGLKTLLASAVACWLLSGCAAQRNEAQQPPSLNAESRLRVAEAAEASGDRSMAISMYTTAANEAPSDIPTQLRCAEGLARNGRLGEAGILLAHSLKNSPRDVELLRTMGALQVMAGQPDRAIQTLSEVLATKPDDVKALVDKAVALDVLRRHDDAQVLYRRALVLLPGDPAISNDLALSLLLSGRAEAGRQILAPFRNVAGLPERMTVNLGIMDAASGHVQEAQQLLGSRIAATDLADLTRAIGRTSEPAVGAP
jgi:Flp pilus assembly protein TadD